jgi:rubrerythrin
MRTKLIKGFHRLAGSFMRTCRFCGYVGGDWPDSDECPNCGEVN